MSRLLPEWVAKSDDERIPPRVRVRVFERAEGHCEHCGKRLRVHWECDHVRALINGGEHRENNLQAICRDCHRMKTLTDVAEKSRVYRKHAKDIGIKKKRTITRWRKFNGDPVYASRDR